MIVRHLPHSWNHENKWGTEKPTDQIQANLEYKDQQILSWDTTFTEQIALQLYDVLTKVFMWLIFTDLTDYNHLNEK